MRLALAGRARVRRASGVRTRLALVCSGRRRRVSGVLTCLGLAGRARVRRVHEVHTRVAAATLVVRTLVTRPAPAHKRRSPAPNRPEVEVVHLTVRLRSRPIGMPHPPP